jgi:hypothetical protein
MATDRMGPDRASMGRKHEDHIAEVWGGERQRASGSQWSNPADVRENHLLVPLAIAADGKSTTAKSIAITRADLIKLVEQAGGEIPVLPVRFYDDYRLQEAEDWVLLREQDALAWRERAALSYELEEHVAAHADRDRELTERADELEKRAAQLERETAEVQEQLAASPVSLPDGIVAVPQAEYDSLVMAARSVTVPDGQVLIDVEELLHLREAFYVVPAPALALPPEYMDVIQVAYPDASGHEVLETTALFEGLPFEVTSVRTEEGADAGVHLIVNEVRYLNGRLVRNGETIAAVGQQPGA